MDEHTFQDEVRQATATADAGALRAAVLEGELLFLLADEFPPSLFEWIVEFVQTSPFLEMEGAWHLLYIFDSNWESLTESQRTRLIDVLERVYSRFTDWMSCFVITELLGSNYADRQALDVLRRVLATSSDIQRSLVPHGLEHIARSADRSLATDALAALQQMERDPAEIVRDAVRKALQQNRNLNTGKQ